MACKGCGEEAQVSSFSAEIALVPLGQSILENGPVYMVAKPLVCLKCGFTEFVVPKHQLQNLEASVSDVIPMGESARQT